VVKYRKIPPAAAANQIAENARIPPTADLQKNKLCYFMIMVLSCCDLLAVLTSHPLTALYGMLFLTGKLDVYTFTDWAVISSTFSVVFVGFSLLALLVMNFDRYLATSHPIFHRTSLTKGRLLTLLAILITVDVTLLLLPLNVISFPVAILIFIIIIIPPMLFMNYKLFTIARKSRRNNGISPEMKKTKTISSCLLAVVCFVVLNIPVFVYIGLTITLTPK
jgi:hypothetical protein